MADMDVCGTCLDEFDGCTCTPEIKKLVKFWQNKYEDMYQQRLDHRDRELELLRQVRGYSMTILALLKMRGQLSARSDIRHQSVLSWQGAQALTNDIASGCRFASGEDARRDIIAVCRLH